MSIDDSKNPNASFLVSLKQGRLRLLISRNSRSSNQPIGPDTGGTNEYGLMDDRSGPFDELIPKKKASGLINFWDLGQIRNAPTDEIPSPPWADLPLSIVLDPPVSSTSIEPGGVDCRLLTQGNVDSLVSLIEAVPRADWKARYRKFAKGYAYKYRMDLSLGSVAAETFRIYTRYEDSDENWTDNGLKISASDLADTILLSSSPGVAFADNNIFPGFYIQTSGDSFKPKITATSDYTGPEIAFTPGKNMDVYLAPTISRHVSRSVVGSVEYLLNNILKVRTRQFYTPVSEGTSPFDRDNAIVTYSSDDGTDAYDFLAESIETYQAGIANTTAYTRPTSGGSWSAFSTSAYPPSGISEAFTAAYGCSTEGLNVLLCVINKGNDWYYFWSK